MSEKETYLEGLCRLLRDMVGKTIVSTERKTFESEWSLCRTIGDLPPWLRGDNWMLPRHAADAIERLRDEHRAACEELTASHEYHGNEVGALTERLSLAIHERDEARRMLCEEWAKQDGLPLDWQGRRGAEGMADFVKWDCFKENTND